MADRDPLKPPKLPVTGFHKRNLAALVAIAVVALAAVVYILSGDKDSGIVRTEPRIPPRPQLPPTALLEEPPPIKPPPRRPPPIWEPPEPQRPHVPAPPPQPPPRAAKGFDAAITSTGSPSPGSQRKRPGPLAGTPEFLDKALRDLERQQARLEGLLPGRRAPQPSTGSSQETPVRFREPAAGLRIDQGTLVEAQLLTAIDSHLPGQILAQINHDVFDSKTLRTLLLPKGSRLLGRYDQDLALGQNRLFVTWERILFPDGSSLEMPAQPGVDAQGRSGLRDRVNHHVGRIFGHAALLSLIGAGFELAQPADAELSRSRLAISGASRELESAAAQLLRERTSIPPTIKIRAGMRFHVLLNRDLDFKRPYRR